MSRKGSAELWLLWLANQALPMLTISRKIL